MSEMLFDEYFTLTLDTFLYNAGIVGFIEVLKACDAKEGKNTEDKKDYFICEQTLEVRKDFLSDADLAQGYIDAVCEKFRKDTFFEKMETSDKIYTRELSKINSQYKIDEKKGKIKGGKYRQAISKIGLLQKKDYESELKNLDDIERLEKIKDILNIIENDKIASSIFNFNSVTGKITAFWRQFAFLDYSNTAAYSLNLIMEKYFVNAVRNTLADEKDSEKIHDCFMCQKGIYDDYAYESLGQSKKENNNKSENKKYYNTSFINGLAQDLSSKSSHFWNYKHDVYLCPLCAFVYACTPLGFLDVGYSSFVFINKNSSIQDILGEIEVYRINNKLDDKNKPNFFHNYIAIKIEKKNYDFYGIEFVINEMVGDKYRYSIKNIDGNITDLLKISATDIRYIYGCNKTYKLVNKNDLNIFNECVDNIFSGRNQYDLITKVLYSKISNTKGGTLLLVDDIEAIKIIWSVLLIQIRKNTRFSKENDMNGRIEKAKKICEAGDRLRREIAKNMDIYNYKSDDKVADKVKSISFKLANAVRSGNSISFFDIVSHLYPSLGADMPTLFIDMFGSTDEFKELGYAYIIGLQNGYKKENKAGEENE